MPAVIIGCLPPFKIFLSRNPSFAPYTSGSAGPYLQSGASSTPAKPRVWSDTAPPQRRLYQNLDFELHSRNTDIVGGAGARVVRNTTLPRESVDSGRPGEIRMVKEFVSVIPRFPPALNPVVLLTVLIDIERDHDTIMTGSGRLERYIHKRECNLGAHICGRMSTGVTCTISVGPSITTISLIHW